MLSSGSRDSSILHHDMRLSRSVVQTFIGHQQEVCGLAWSPDNKYLASGGNENLLCIWDPTRGSSSSGGSVNSNVQPNSSTVAPLYSFDQHQAAVKALAWCPFQRNVLALGGGTADRMIRIWNVGNGSSVRSVDSGSQVC